MWLYLQSFGQLLRFQYFLLRGDFHLLYRKVQEYRCTEKVCSQDQIVRVCRAIDTACLWYPKQVLCLQRSAATVCLLRSWGVPANMMIGVQDLPVRAHAWVEIEGHVANDKSYVREMYKVLARC